MDLETVPGLLRADRVEVSPLNFLVRNFTGNTGRWGDLGLFADGTVVYLPVADVIDKPWLASLDDLGQPGDVSEAFVRWRSAGFLQRPSTVRSTSMTLRLDGKTRILRFTGFVPANSRFWNVVTKVPLPHHLGYVPKAAFVLKQTMGSGSRADNAATYWRAAIAAWHQAGLNTKSADVSELATSRGETFAAVTGSAALTSVGRAVAWDGKTVFDADAPPLTAIAANDSHVLGLTAQGTVIANGAKVTDGLPPAKVPKDLPHVIAIAASPVSDIALTSDGKILEWGQWSLGRAYHPRELPHNLAAVVAIAANDHNLGLTVDGKVFAWGGYSSESTNVPDSLPRVVAIAAGGNHSLALTPEGRVVAWGNLDELTNVPRRLSRVIAIAAGQFHSLALTSTGKVVAWGVDVPGPDSVPRDLPPAIAIAAGSFHSLALTCQGTIVSWGHESFMVSPRMLSASHRV